MKLPNLNRRCVLLLAAALCFSGCAAAAAGPLQWEHGPGYRRARLGVPAQGKTGFSLMPSAATGIHFTNVLTEARIMANANLLNGSGVALGDYDGDGFCDLYFCDLGGRNALYRNLGNWKFTNVTDNAGVACPGQSSTGAVFADIDGDRRLDLLVSSMGGPNACFRNLGEGRFTNITASAGLTSRLGSASMALADIEGNGTLDLYVANYGATSLLRSGGALSYRMVNGKPVVTGRHARRIKIIDGVMYELGEPDALYLNDGNGRFRAASWTDGTFLDASGKPLADAPWDQGLTVLLRDLNGDRHPDLYVCNDASTPDRFWINDGHGRFRALDPLAWRQTSYYSMCVDAADLDRDGRDELFVIDMLSRDHRLVMTQMSDMHPQPRRIGFSSDQPQIRRNTLFHAREDGTYAEIARFSGMAASDWSWGAMFLDVDLDGWEDALIANGFAYDMDDLDTREGIRRMGPLSVSESRRKVLMYPRLETPNVAFRNLRDLTFREVSAEWGFASKQVSNGMAAGDLDNDGDMDLVINCLNAPALLYRNDSPAPRLAVRLRGNAPNTQGIGAKITVRGGPVVQTQEIISGGRYVSGDEAMRVFAAGDATQLVIETVWRSGRKNVVGGAVANFVYEIDEAGAAEHPAPAPSKVAPMFEDASALLNHSHHETPFDDTARQPLLPRLLSQMGPGVAWFDFDADGYEDLLIGAGRGGRLGLFRNDDGGGFARIASSALNTPLADDLAGLAGFARNGVRSVLAALGSYESSSASSLLAFEASGTNLLPRASIAAGPGSVGPLAIGDVDNDGALDLFVGGQVIFGRYPEAAASRLYRQAGGNFQLDEERSRAFDKAGLVNGAVLSDLNADGFLDIVLACDWGPVRVYLNENGRFTEATEKLGLSQQIGWWNGVTTGDFNNDGRLDIAASNWGRNTRYEQHRHRPLRLYYGDLDGSGTLDLVEAYLNPALNKIVPEHPLDIMAKGLPLLRSRVPSHRAYAQSSVEELFGEPLKSAKLLEANWLESTVFLNRGDHFEARPLPREAQFAPGFGISVGDFDGDGNEDLFLAQNFFALTHEVGRYDAGRGLWLKGDGTGNFTAVSGQHSGVKVHGEQRGCALADFNADGRVDLVVTQNGTETKLFRNIGAKPGYRVRLRGPTANPLGIGAAIRLFFGEKVGPLREIHAGSGYWSQDGAVQVLGAGETATRLEVRWPGGSRTAQALAPNEREIEIVYGD